MKLRTREKKTVRVAIAAGGTGGHIMPALALAETLANIGHPVETQFFCGNRPVERQIYADAGIEPNILPVGSVNAKGLLNRMFQTGGMGFGFARSLVKMRGFDVAVGMGGYITAPVLSTAWLSRVPILLHESNSVMGRVNRLLAPKAKAIVCGMPLTSIPEKVDRNAIFEYGTPVRMSITHGDRQTAAPSMYLRADAFTIFIYGGSQGARGLNNLMAATLGLLGPRWPSERPLQILWAAGPNNLEEVREALKHQPVKGQLYIAPTIQRMEDAYALADLVVGRAGGSFLAELLACGLPSLLFPLPSAAEDHQFHNARVLQRRRAAEVFDEEDTTPENLAERILALAGAPDEMRQMSEAARALACPGAARDMARLIVRTALGTDDF